MKKGEFIFVYGTLRRGEVMDLGRQALTAQGVKFCHEDDINGELYHMGAYPGVKAQPQDVFNEILPYVHGDVFFIRDASVPAILDAYESYMPDAPTTGLYNRIETKTAGGKTVWVYTYNDRVTSDQRIESGDWCKNPDMPIRRRSLRG